MNTNGMKVLIPALFAAALMAGCATLESGEVKEEKTEAPPGTEKKEPEEDPAAKREALERKLELAGARLKHANMELEVFEVGMAAKLSQTEGELEIAKAKLSQFTRYDAPNRTARAELGLKGSRDAAVEAEEELKQLEIMYDEQDLEDMTAEFVINRGKRNAERRAIALAIEEKAFEALVEQEIPREQASMELEVANKAGALEKAKLESEAGRLQKKIVVMDIESEMKEIKEKLAKLADKEKQK